jgi:hypothetical protein
MFRRGVPVEGSHGIPGGSRAPSSNPAGLQTADSTLIVGPNCRKEKACVTRPAARVLASPPVQIRRSRPLFSQPNGHASHRIFRSWRATLHAKR